MKSIYLGRDTYCYFDELEIHKMMGFHHYGGYKDGDDFGPNMKIKIDNDGMGAMWIVTKYDNLYQMIHEVMETSKVIGYEEGKEEIQKSLKNLLNIS